MAIKFDNKAPEWDNLGAEPDAELKKGGFLAGYKPPAAYFNWFFNRTYECVKELQEKLVSNLKSLAFKDKVGDDDITAVAANKVTQDSKHRMITDAERSTWNGKADASGGDVSEMTVKTLETITTEFPVPVAGECTKTFLGKVKKFFEDTKNWMTGVCLIGQIVNNCVTNNAKLPLSAAQGKVLMDLYTVLNTKSEWKLLETIKGRQAIELPQQGTFSELIAVVSYTYSVTRNYFIPIPAISLPANEQRANIGTGRGGDLGEHVSVSLAISATSIRLATFVFDGIAYEANATLAVYYR